MYQSDPFMSDGFGAMPWFVGLFFIVVIGFILFVIFSGVAQWSKNNNSPIENVIVTVVARRTEIYGGGETRANQDYYVTFEDTNNNRFELEVPTNKFGMIVEGDKGELSFQGTRFLEFTRIIE